MMFTTFPKPYTLNTAPGRWVGQVGTPAGGGGGGWNKRQASCFMVTNDGTVAAYVQVTRDKLVGREGDNGRITMYRSSTAGRYSFRYYSRNGVQQGPMITRTGMSALVDAVNANVNLNVYIKLTLINNTGTGGDTPCSKGTTPCDDISASLNFEDATVLAGGKG